MTARELGREGLGGRYPDLEPGAGVQHAVGLARAIELPTTLQMATRPRAVLLGRAQRRQRVGGLAGLRDGHGQDAAVEHGAPIAKLGGDVHLDREAGELLHEILADQRRVPGGAARDEARAGSSPARSRSFSPSSGIRIAPVSAIDAIADRVADRPRLLVRFP